MLLCPSRIVVTPQSLAAFTMTQICDALGRHMVGDWGEMCEEDQRLDDAALVDGSRVFSAYIIDGEKLWAITEAVNDDGFRESTTLPLPEVILGSVRKPLSAAKA